MAGSQDRAKDAVGRAAAQLVESGMHLGLGSGSTFNCFLDHVGKRMKEEGLKICGVPSSDATAGRAAELGIELISLDDVVHLDLTIDGADEVDPQKNLIKGGGAALTREKIIASAAREMVVMVDESKMVPVLGQEFPLPVEVMKFGYRQAAARLRHFDCEPTLRMRGGEPLITDNGNYILDCKFEIGIPDPQSMEREINLIPGVLDNGLFHRMAGRILVANQIGDVRVIQ